MTDCVNFHEFKGFDQYGLYEKNQENKLPLQVLIFKKVKVFFVMLTCINYSFPNFDWLCLYIRLCNYERI